MTVQSRNNVRIIGKGPITLVLVHGFGFDQSAWRYVTGAFEDRFRLVLIDLVGSGQSDSAAYDPVRHLTLHGHADDLLEIVDEFANGPVVLIGHSVGSMTSLLATLKRPGRFAGLVMIGPSPSLINEGGYIGGFDRQDIASFLESLESNFLGWSSMMAPAVLGTDAHRKQNIAFADSLSRNDLDIAKHFARVTLLSDHRDDLRQVTTPTLIVQSTSDPFVPRSVGQFIQQSIAGSILALVENTGHCPHISAPEACIETIDAFLHTLPTLTNGQSNTNIAGDR